MNLGPWGDLTILAAVLEIVFAACVFVYIGRLERRVSHPMGEQVGAHKAVLAKVNPGLVETRAFAAKNGYPLDRPYMSAVGEARDLIGELVIESINTKGASPNLERMAKDRVTKVNDLLQDTGEFGK